MNISENMVQVNGFFMANTTRSQQEDVGAPGPKFSHKLNLMKSQKPFLSFIFA
jgi:hypothetical protein